MPKKPPHPCRHPGCPALTDGAYCVDHRQQHEHRQSAAARGYDAKWQRARLRYLREHPLCVTCCRQGRLTVASVVDHIVPHRGDEQRFWDRSNWQALCKPCHDAKTARENGGFGNPCR